MSELPTNVSRRLLTGDRPTGRLHLGHYLGSLANRVRLQHEYDTILIIADLHMLTTKPDRAAIQEIGGNARAMVLDYLAAGIDPQKASIYLQSAVPEIYELNTVLQNMVSVARLSRLPSIKEMARNASMEDEVLPYGLLGYPVLQAADILLPRAALVPIGRDNLAHIEVTREIARRFNQLYGPVFPEPEPMLGAEETLIGTDGKGKMSKSAGNAIFLSDSPAEVARKVKSMLSDPERVRADMPGDPERSPAFAYHRAFNPDSEEVAELEARYRAGRVGDGEVKTSLARVLHNFLEPMRERRAQFETEPDLVDDIVHTGTRRMRSLAIETMSIVRDAMGTQDAFPSLRRV